MEREGGRPGLSSLDVNLLLLELSARRVDIVAAGVPDGGLDAVHGETALESLDLMHRRGLQKACGRVVEGDEVHMA